MAEASAWRVNDVVAYDVMRESAILLAAALAQRALTDPVGADDGREEIAQLRRTVLTVDGFDRSAVTALAAHIGQRFVELTAETS